MFMFTPARYIIYSGEHKKGSEGDLSKMTESMNYFNLSAFSSSKGFSHRRESSHMIRNELQSDH